MRYVLLHTIPNDIILQGKYITPAIFTVDKWKLAAYNARQAMGLQLLQPHFVFWGEGSCSATACR
jgi:hypothetical protein